MDWLNEKLSYFVESTTGYEAYIMLLCVCSVLVFAKLYSIRSCSKRL